MDVWIPKADADSAILTFQDPDNTTEYPVARWDNVFAAQGRRQGSLWETPWAYIRGGAPGHFVSCAGLLACRDQAWHLLEADLTGDVEALPVSTEQGTYCVLNVLPVVDCLRGGVFDTRKLGGRVLFRTPPHPLDVSAGSQVYATEGFKALVERHRLTNIEFIRPFVIPEDIAARMAQGLPPAGIKKP